MKIYNIAFTESRTAYFGVEAASEEEALQRFEEWRVSSDYVYNSLDANTYNIEHDAAVCPDVCLIEDDILTDEDYKNGAF